MYSQRDALAATVVARQGDATIARDDQSSTWTVTAGGAVLTIAAGPSADFAVSGLTTTSGRQWAIAKASDATVTAAGQVTTFGQSDAGFRFVDVTASTTDHGVRLDVAYQLQPARLTVTRHYVVTAGSPAFETWTSFAAASNSAATDVSQLNALTLTIPAGPVQYLQGLLGDSADSEQDAAFTLHQRTIASGGRLTLGSARRSSERELPWICVHVDTEEFFTALLWSGGWSFTAAATDAKLALAFSVPTTTTVSGVVETPHAVFGVVRGGRAQATAALRSYIIDGLRGGRPFAPLVTYNTWYGYGTRVDQDSVRDAILRAAALGAELFVLDAGWYTRADAGGVFDFDTGLGTWEVDAERFPDGLRPLRDYAHGLGMKFGIWVEPERVSLDAVGGPGLADPAWLAQEHGAYGSERSAQICLSAAGAQRWVLGKLTALVDDVQPDYLKWDNNLWVNCDRPGHGHGALDGSFAHVNALYGVLAALRQRYPDLLIENVSGGGNRLDLGMMRYTDVAWVDDRTAPARHVRHNAEGLSVLFPPAYLLSFVIDHRDEPAHENPDPLLTTRSRALGALGLSFRLSSTTDADTDPIRAVIDVAKSVSDIQATASAVLLTPQVKPSGGPGWDVVQESANDGHRIVIFAFQTDPGVDRVAIKPVGLRAQTMYEVRSADAGVLGVASGSDLIANGIGVYTSPVSAAHVLVLTAQP